MSSKLLPVQWGTLGGTLASALSALYTSELLKAVLLALIGACVSFITSHYLKLLMRKYRKRKRKA